MFAKRFVSFAVSAFFEVAYICLLAEIIVLSNGCYFEVTKGSPACPAYCTSGSLVTNEPRSPCGQDHYNDNREFCGCDGKRYVLAGVRSVVSNTQGLAPMTILFLILWCTCNLMKFIGAIGITCAKACKEACYFQCFDGGLCAGLLAILHFPGLPIPWGAVYSETNDPAALWWRLTSLALELLPCAILIALWAPVVGTTKPTWAFALASLVLELIRVWYVRNDWLVPKPKAAVRMSDNYVAFAVQSEEGQPGSAVPSAPPAN
ncbi:MAG: hypothetical protein KGL39_27655 [Patescibacteria group bacterium]|nr:hypothetical protein [Patescibacteria group bacterium]